MDSVYKGTMKKLNKPVPPEDLLDMWKQKRNYLDKVAEQNRKKGNEILGVNRDNASIKYLCSCLIHNLRIIIKELCCLIIKIIF